MQQPHSPFSPRQRINDVRLYLCMDSRRHCDQDKPRFTALRELAEQACEGGVDALQLRDKNSPGEQQYGVMSVAEQMDALHILREVAHSYGALLSVNDRMDLAVAVEADIAHVGQDDIPPAVARKILGDTVALGLSCRSRTHVDAAITNPDLDYFCAGPVWATPTKPGRTPVGVELISYAAQRHRELAEAGVSPAPHPWFAIGGIDTTNASDVVRAGASRLVVVRAITAAADPAEAARTLRAIATGNTTCG